MCGQRRRLRNLPGGGYFLQVPPDGALDCLRMVRWIQLSDIVSPHSKNIEGASIFSGQARFVAFHTVFLPKTQAAAENKSSKFNRRGRHVIGREV